MGGARSTEALHVFEGSVLGGSRPRCAPGAIARGRAPRDLCSFWLASALAEIGELDRALRLCEKLLLYASSLQLYAEQLEPHTGRHLGNFPQAFSHLALINAVVHVIRAERREEPGRFGPMDS